MSSLARTDDVHYGHDQHQSARGEIDGCADRMPGRGRSSTPRISLCLPSHNHYLPTSCHHHRHKHRHHHHHHHHRHKYYLVCGVQTFSKWKFWFNFKEAQIGAWCRRKYEFCAISKFKWLWAFTISQKNTITQEWHWVGSSQNYIWSKIGQHWEVEAYDKRKNWQLMTLFFNFPKVQ